jgi:hypothetical protein
LALFCTMGPSSHAPGVSSRPRSAKNWVRFARFTPRTSQATQAECLCPHTPIPLSLASFCTIPSVRPHGGARFGSFCTLCLFMGWASPPDTFRPWPNLVRFACFTPRPSYRRHDGLRPHPPVLPSLASFCRFRLRERPNWVRFARLASGRTQTAETTKSPARPHFVRPQPKPVLAPRRKERQEDSMAVLFTLAILASWRET